jgi:hypothetical protein
MKMKKYLSIAFAALLGLVVASCNKAADVEAIEPKLPLLQLSSLGYQQTGPFTTGTTLSINFGATATNTPVGAFKLEIISGTSVTATSVVLKTVNFPTWSGKDDTSVGTTTVHTISYVSEETSYPNTVVYGGTINLKLSSLGLAAGGTYSVRATAYSFDGLKTSQLVQTSFFKTI